MTLAEIESRLKALEQRMDQCTGVLPPRGAPATNKRWVEEVWGAFANDPLFDEAMRLGRKWREADRPKAKAKKSKRR
jgi:hypothetical protein